MLASGRLPGEHAVANRRQRRGLKDTIFLGCSPLGRRQRPAEGSARLGRAHGVADGARFEAGADDVLAGEGPARPRAAPPAHAPPCENLRTRARWSRGICQPVPAAARPHPPVDAKFPEIRSETRAEGGWDLRCDGAFAADPTPLPISATRTPSRRTGFPYGFAPRICTAPPGRCRMDSANQKTFVNFATACAERTTGVFLKTTPDDSPPYPLPKPAGARPYRTDGFSLRTRAENEPALGVGSVLIAGSIRSTCSRCRGRRAGLLTGEIRSGIAPA